MSLYAYVVIVHCRASSYVIVIVYHLAARRCHVLRCRLTSTSRFIVRSCGLLLSYVVVVHCRRPVSDKADHCFLSLDEFTIRN